MKYKVGDWIKHNEQSGRIVHIDTTHGTIFYGIEYDEYEDYRHDCQGHGRNGHCWYETEHKITKRKFQQLELF